MNRSVLTLLGLIVVAAVLRWQIVTVDVGTAVSPDTLPFEIGSWQGRRAADYEPDVLAMLGVDAYVNRAYASADGTQANLYVGYYRSQSQSGSIHSPLNCMPGAGWQPEQVARVPFADGTARQVVVTKGGQRLLVHYWYQSPTRIEGDEYRGRLYAALDTVRFGRNDAALVRVTVPIDSSAGGFDRAVEQATDLARAVEPQVAMHLFPPTSGHASLVN